MEIIEYTPAYETAVKDLLVELQTYLAQLDPDHIIIVSDRYRDDYFAHAMAAVEKHGGKVFLAVCDGRAVGAVICLIPPYGEESKLTTTCPKCGFISDLVVTAAMRGKSIGKTLLTRAETYFAQQHCAWMQFSVYARNTSALTFYEHYGMQKDCCYLKKKITS